MMPRAYRHLTWRAHRTKRTSRPELQTLVRSDQTLHWVTVARGASHVAMDDDWEDLIQIAQALNRARFALYDIRPVARKEKRR